MAGHVDGELAELEHLALRLGIGVDAAQQGAHAGDQLARAERLDQVVVGAQLQADDAVLDLALGGEHDDGHVGVVADGAANALAGNAREHEVKDDQVEVVLGEFLQRLLAVADGGYPIVLALKICGYGIADGLLVLHQQDAPGFVAHEHSSTPFRKLRFHSFVEPIARTSSLCAGLDCNPRSCTACLGLL